MEQILSKEESLKKITEGILVAGITPDNTDIMNFLENFEEKYGRYPQVEEINLIVKSYIQYHEGKKLSTIRETVNVIKKQEESKKATSVSKFQSSNSPIEKKLSPEIKPLEEGRIITIAKPEGRRHCPTCGNASWFKIHETVDKTRIISTFPRIYGKKYSCSGCGCLWREK